ncbi:nitrite reductase large subunit NirB [Aquibacillus rhizosphaerae]|uniref:Nitrite reductase large subunit NirB n=1 Tax=Aquibacillus rhizosphaerae TaxID=3051431 RepID=A0ABT7L8T7_9BACI|nr:nitrite reductase large subunit NirB [Aquibacillus sp. LR5S19]MDL4842282.1 nitrite reductase large subunit NirB [Aquibacillus sp. LR5S19]
MRKQKLVLIGNGMAGLRCIENILKEDNSLYEITIFGSEPHGNYNRIMLSSVLQGNTLLNDITLNHPEWYEKNNIQLFTGETVIEIDKKNKTIKSDKNREVAYDKLILATGSNPFILPLPGANKEGVISFRTIEDCHKMMDTAKQYKKAVVIGGGLLGLEAARGLLNLGMKVDVVHLSDSLMDRQLDKTAAKMLQLELEEQGMNFLLKKETDEILGANRVDSIRFKDGSIVETDLVVMSVGVKPNVSLAKSSGIETNRGIIVDDHLKTNSPDIYAVGECAEHNGMVYGLVKPLYDQGEILAQHLCKKSTGGYKGSVLSTKLKISGVDVFSVGQFTTDENTKSICFHDEVTSIYKKICFRDDKAVGAVLFGDTKESTKLLDVIGKKKFVPDQEKTNLLKSTDISESFVATLPKKEFICTCNSVSKGTIIDTVLENNLSQSEEVKAHTKASSSCGGCKPAVCELLDYIKSDHFNETSERKSFCSCTTLTEDEVVSEIQTQNLTTINEITYSLNWGTEHGCTTCRPALNYYLGMIDPEYEQNQESLYVNERMNAIEQKDGSYSIIPQLYGGMVQTDQLRKIANVADKFGLSSLALTSDQRIHIKGISKDDLSLVWSELDMQLHSATVNTVQSINTSNGNYLCDCDKQPASDMVTGLEKTTEFIRTPYRIRIAVSACTHNGARLTTKDIAAIKMSRGWEIYIGGSIGRNVRSGELFYVAKTKEKALQLIIGFIQYYRESANYLEQPWQWIDRVSLVHIREVLFDREILQYLINRLETDQAQRKRLLVKN